MKCYDFVVVMYQHNIDIRPYIALKKITKEEYFKITGVEFEEAKD